MITYDAILCISMICCSAVVVFASNKGPISYLKVLVNNKKSNKPAQVLVSDYPSNALPTRMTLRDVHLHVAMTDAPRSSPDYGSNDRHKTAVSDTKAVDGGTNAMNGDTKAVIGDTKAVIGDTKAINGNTRAITDKKKETKGREHEALVQQMCSEIMSAVHQKIGEHSTGDPASGSTTYRMQVQRPRQSSRKVWPRPVGITSYYERLQKESAGNTIGPDVRYHDPIYAQDANRVDYLNSYPLAKSNGVVTAEEDDEEEDLEQSPKVWKLNMVGKHEIYKSAKSREHHSDASVAAAEDNDDQTL